MLSRVLWSERGTLEPWRCQFRGIDLVEVVLWKRSTWSRKRPMGDALKFRGDARVKAICRLQLQLLPQDEPHDNNFIAQVIVSRRVHL